MHAAGRTSHEDLESALAAEAARLQQAFASARALTEGLVASLSPEDLLLQSLPEASPVKWHLAHTSWFFDTFVLAQFDADYRPFRAEFRDLFNSYYEAIGPQPERQSRAQAHPRLLEVLAYRAFVDADVPELLERAATLGAGAGRALLTAVELGVQHEQQHQELILTDVKHALFQSPGRPSFGAPAVPRGPAAAPLGWVQTPEGLAVIGAGPSGFAFDNERAQHRVFLSAHGLGDRLITNGEYRDFVRDGSYARPELWLSDGWTLLRTQGWSRPLYWEEDLESHFSLAGPVELDAAAPVAHLSYYEADAFARWAGARLPTEAEWERAARVQPAALAEGNFLDRGYLAPRAGQVGAPGAMAQLFGDVWEWTQSAYLPYPGFRPEVGAFGEYNGKFMINQMVLRGGSAFSSRDHLRPSYRNFFPPAARWQLSGLRLARDGQRPAKRG